MMTTSRKAEDIMLFITPKFYSNVFLFICLLTLGAYWILIELRWVYKHFTTNYNLQKEWFYVSSLGMYINLSAIVLSL